jgi:hypothetical protein
MDALATGRTQDPEEQKEQAIHRPFRFEGPRRNVNRSERNEESAKDRFTPAG